jgi:hypothetical protein
MQFAWVGMILCLTPNIQELNLLVSPSVPYYEIITDEKRAGLLGMLFGTCNVGGDDQPQKHLLPSLNRLKSLNVRGFTPEWPSLQLPALRRLVLEKHHTLPPPQDSMPPATIRELVLGLTHMGELEDNTHLSSCLGRFTQLVSLEVSGDRQGFHGDAIDFPFWMEKIQPVASTLETLEFLCGNLVADALEYPGQFRTKLNFPHLRNLTVPQIALVSRYDPDDSPRLPLWALLPPTLEVLTIEYPNKTVFRLYKELVDNLESHFPRLQCLVIERIDGLGLTVEEFWNSPLWEAVRDRRLPVQFT